MSPARPEERIKRRLAVILASDVAGYSRLVAQDEEDTVRRLGVITGRFRELVSGHDGRIFNTAGDAILAEFMSAVDAVRCALDVQDAAAAANIARPADRHIVFRIGIAVGDVIVAADGDLLGDGVNIAARLEGLAQPGGICVSEEVRSHVQPKIDAGFTDLGLRELKNLARPVHAFAVGLTAPAVDRPPPRTRLRPWYVLAPIAIVGAVVAIWFWVDRAAQKAAGIPFVADQVPFVSDKTRAMLKEQFVSGPEHKALSLARDGFGIALGAPTREQAILVATEKCEAQSKAGCDAFAVDAERVWPRPLPALPAPGDIRSAGLEPIALDRLPLVSPDEVARATQAFGAGREPKALAVGARGLFGWAYDTGSTDEAVRRALERCADRNGAACLLYAVGSTATEPVPRSHALKGYFDLASDPSVPAMAKAPLSLTYRGPDWRALAKSEDGQWYASAGQSSEDQAVATALAQCRGAQKTGCSLQAIGGFQTASD